MNEINFKICCPSCETVFEVTDPSLIGQIVACPKCGGMILIENPEPNAEVAPSAQTQTKAEPEVAEQESAREVDACPAQVKTPTVAQSVANFPQINVDATPKVEESVASIESDDAPSSPWRVRLIMALSGVVCAAIVAILAQALFHPESSEEVESGANADNVQTEGTSSVDDGRADDTLVLTDDSTEDSNDEEDEPEIELTRAEDVDATNDEFDPSAAVELEDEAVESESESESASADETAETNETENVENVEVEEADLDVPEEQTEDEDEIDLVADEESDELEDSELDGAEEEENEADDESLPTEFNEEEFEKANQESEESKGDDEEEEDLGAVASTTDANLQAALPTLKIAPKTIDVDLQTNLKIRSIEFPESPAAAVRLLSEFSAVPIEFDLENFELMRSSIGARLDLSLTDVDVKSALDALAELLKWKSEIQADRIVLKPIDDVDAIVEEKFDVNDLLVGELPFDATSSNEIEALEPIDTIKLAIENLIAPDAWEVNGGNGTLVSEGSTLIVKQNSVNRKRVADLLDRIRALHGLDAKGEAASETLIPETLGWERLTKTISFNLLKPTTLQQAIEIIEKTQKIGVLWDDAALNEFGAGRDSTTVAGVDNATIDQVLFGMLDPLMLTYVVLDENLILITTKERAAEYKTTEIHLYATPDATLSKDQTLALVEEMKSSVAPKSWSEPDVSLWIDSKSGCWIVRQSQPVQREIRRWTSERLVKKITEKKANPQ